MNIYLNTSCSMIINDRNVFQKYYSNLIIKQLVFLISIREIENIMHYTIDYAIVNIYINDYVFDQFDIKISIINKFDAKLHLIDDLKINLLIDNDVLNTQKTTINHSS